MPEVTLRVLLTGGTGFIGSHLARALLEAGHATALLVRNLEKVERVFGAARAREFEIVTGDVTDEDVVKRALRGRSAVIHGAALVSLERKNAGRVLRDNRRGIEVVVGNALAAGIERVLYMSSVVALLDTGQSNVTTEMLGGHNGSAYTRSKIECERYARSLQASGAPLRTTYPAAVIGPDDPGLSEANRGLLAFFRDATIVTEGGLQIADVRDVAAAHLCLLEAPVGPGRHLLGGHFLPWSRLADLLEEITGRKLRRYPVPGGIMRAAGRVADVIKHIWDFQFPLSQEAMRIMTQGAPIESDGADDTDAFTFRDPRQTLGDTLRWFSTAGYFPAARLGLLGP